LDILTRAALDAAAFALVVIPEHALTIPRLLRLVLPGLIAAYLLGSTGAQAHAILVSSIPAAGGTAQPGAAVLEFHFNSRIDHVRSRLTLVWPDHRETVLKLDAGTDDEVLASHVDLVPGAFALRWQVLAVDGHITRGEVAFSVAPEKGR
jgi:methionine-rich copper-binding protein CopC